MTYGTFEHLRRDIDLWYIYDLPSFDIGILKIKD